MKPLIFCIILAVSIIQSYATAKNLQPPVANSGVACGWYEPHCWNTDACTDRPGECLGQGSVYVKILSEYRQLYRCGALPGPSRLLSPVLGNGGVCRPINPRRLREFNL